MALDDTPCVMLGLGLETSYATCVKHMQWYHDRSARAVICAGWKSCLHSRNILVQNS